MKNLIVKVPMRTNITLEVKAQSLLDKFHLTAEEWSVLPEEKRNDNLFEYVNTVVDNMPLWNGAYSLETTDFNFWYVEEDDTTPGVEEMTRDSVLSLIIKEFNTYTEEVLKYSTPEQIFKNAYTYARVQEIYNFLTEYFLDELDDEDVVKFFKFVKNTYEDGCYKVISTVEDWEFDFYTAQWTDYDKMFDLVWEHIKNL